MASTAIVIDDFLNDLPRPGVPYPNCRVASPRRITCGEVPTINAELHRIGHIDERTLAGQKGSAGVGAVFTVNTAVGIRKCVPRRRVGR
jgi:hypothetical protein